MDPGQFHSVQSSSSSSCIHLIFRLGAVDADVVKNTSQIEWHKVVPFSPFANERNSTSYLQWVLRLSGFGVSDSCAYV